MVVEHPLAVVMPAESGETLLAKTLGRRVEAVSYLAQQDTAMLQLDSEIALYFRILNGHLLVEMEAPRTQ